LSFGSSGTPRGRFIFTDPATGVTHDLTPNAGASMPVFDGSQTGCDRTDDYHCFATADRFNFATYNLLLTPSERTGAFGQFRFHFNDRLQGYAKALFNRRESVNQAAPEPIFLGPDAGTGNPLADGIFISAANPYNPFGFDLVSVDDPATPENEANLVMIGRRPVEGGPRVFEQQVDTTYFGAGLEGTFEAGARTWFWDVNLATSRNEAEQVNYGSYNILNIATALGDPAVCAATPGGARRRGPAPRAQRRRRARRRPRGAPAPRPTRPPPRPRRRPRPRGGVGRAGVGRGGGGGLPHGGVPPLAVGLGPCGADR